jgi:hypothetical protein
MFVFELHFSLELALPQSFAEIKYFLGCDDSEILCFAFADVHVKQFVVQCAAIHWHGKDDGMLRNGSSYLANAHNNTSNSTTRAANNRTFDNVLLLGQFNYDTNASLVHHWVERWSQVFSTDSCPRSFLV